MRIDGKFMIVKRERTIGGERGDSGNYYVGGDSNGREEEG